MSRTFVIVLLAAVVMVPLAILGWARFAPVDTEYAGDPPIVGVWESRQFEYRQPAWEPFDNCRLVILQASQVPAGSESASETAFAARLLLGNTLNWSPDTTGSYREGSLQLGSVTLTASIDDGGRLLLTAPDGRTIRLQKVASGGPARRLWEKSLKNRLP